MGLPILYVPHPLRSRLTELFRLHDIACTLDSRDEAGDELIVCSRNGDRIEIKAFALDKGSENSGRCFGMFLVTGWRGFRQFFRDDKLLRDVMRILQENGAVEVSEPPAER